MTAPVLKDFTLTRDEVTEAKALLGQVIEVQAEVNSTTEPSAFPSSFPPSKIVNVDAYTLESFTGDTAKWVSLSLEPLDKKSDRWWMVVDAMGVNVVVAALAGRESLPGVIDRSRSGFVTVEAIGDIGQAVVTEGGKNISRGALVLHDAGNNRYACFERFTGGGNYSMDGLTINRSRVKHHAL